MLADGRTVPNGELLDTDVCVVGAGMSGITLAVELAAAGIDVVLLERGDRTPSVPRTRPDTVENIGIPYDVAASRAFELGGTAHTWGVRTPLGDGFGRLRELDPEDFESRSWIPHSGWPFGKDHLSPYYRRARSLFDSGQEPRADLPNEAIDEPTPVGFAADVEERTFLFANPGGFPGELRRRLEQSTAVIVLTNSTASEIKCDGSGPHVSSVEVKTSTTHSYTVRAQAYVLASGGIETPRLLLASRGRHPGGIGNTHDLVGRFFMEHPHYDSGVLITSRGAKVFGRDTFHGMRLENGVPFQPTFSLPEPVVRQEGLNRSVFRFDAVPVGYVSVDKKAIHSLEAAGQLRRSITKRSRPESGYLPTTKTAVKGVHQIARLAMSRGIERLRADADDRWFRMVVMAEQQPNPSSRVELRYERDRVGVPIGTLDWQLTGQDLASMQRSQQLMSTRLMEEGQRGARSLLRDGQLPTRLIGGHHHMGTTRMHPSERQGVVDPDGRVHGVGNLYIAGSGVFPTSGYANPTLTLLALTLRLGDQLTRQVIHHR